MKETAHFCLGVGEASDAGLKSIEHLEGMLVSVSSEETRIRKERLQHEAKIAALNGKPAPPELEAEEFRFLEQGILSTQRKPNLFINGSREMKLTIVPRW